MIPTELSFPITRTTLVESGNSDEARLIDLSLIEVKTEIATIKMLAYQQKMTELYNRQIKE